MEKLLHERLRELKGKTANEIREREEVCNSDELIDKWSDEIERQYITRPRFEDGEPVQFGDATSLQDCVEAILFKADGGYELHQKFENKFGTSVAIYEPNEFVKRPTNVLDADGIEIKPGETLYGRCRQKHTYTAQKVPDIKEELGERFCVRCYDVNDYEVVWVDPLTVSHDPIVFDADGVEIKVGDTVYSINNGSHQKVTEITPKDKRLGGKDSIGVYGGLSFEADQFTHEKPVFDAECVRICKGDTVWTKKGGSDKVASLHYIGETPVSGLSPATMPFVRYEGGCWNFASEVTHEKPVFDADGVRICKGDTVWDESDKKLEVIQINSEEDICVEEEDGTPRMVDAKFLTHQEPDSLQKIVDDMDASLRGMKVCDLQGYINRLTALIERGA